MIDAQLYGVVPPIFMRLEDEGDLCAKLPGGAELWTQCIVVRTDQHVHWQLVRDLDEPAALKSHGKRPFLTARCPIGGHDRYGPDKPAAGKVVVQERIDRHHRREEHHEGSPSAKHHEGGT